VLQGDWCTAGCKADINFSDQSLRLLAGNFQNEIVTTYRSQKVLKMLPLYKKTVLAPVEEVLIYRLKMLCRNVCHFPKKIFF
jgi:hypothetical protein